MSISKQTFMEHLDRMIESDTRPLNEARGIDSDDIDPLQSYEKFVRSFTDAVERMVAKRFDESPNYVGDPRLWRFGPKSDPDKYGITVVIRDEDRDKIKVFGTATTEGDNLRFSFTTIRESNVDNIAEQIFNELKEQIERQQ